MKPKTMPFMLVRPGQPEPDNGPGQAAKKAPIRAAGKKSGAARAAPDTLVDTISSGLLYKKADRGGVKPSRPAARPAITGAGVSDLKTVPATQRVGILDLGAWIANLPELIAKLNQAQQLYTLFELIAPIPSGMIKNNAGFRAWAALHAPAAAPALYDGVENQLIEEEFFVAATDIRAALKVDIVVGVTAARLAGLHRGKVTWDCFAAVQARVAPPNGHPAELNGRPRVPLVLMSTSDLREFAAQAGRPFEAAVGMLLVSALMVVDSAQLDYHDDNGCIFDGNWERANFVVSLRQLAICAQCRARMTPQEFSACHSMLGRLRRMRVARVPDHGAGRP